MGGRGWAGNGGRREAAGGSWALQGLKKKTVIVVGFTLEGSLWLASTTNCLGTGRIKPDPGICPEGEYIKTAAPVSQAVACTVSCTCSEVRGNMWFHVTVFFILQMCF